MKVEKVNIPESLSVSWGLKATSMTKLDKVVLIAGKNGAGKTRFLQMLKYCIDQYPNQEELKDIKKQHALYIDAIKGSQEANEYRLSRPVTERTNKDIETTNENIIRYQKDLLLVEEKITALSNLTFLNYKEDNSIFDFVPKSLSLTDSYTISADQLAENERAIYTSGTKNIARGTIPAIELIQRRWVNATTTSTDDLSISQEERQKVIADYEKLKRYIRIFLGTELKRTREGYPEIFGKRYGEAKLSNGQKVLLQFCVALFAQEETLDNLIILMDEPENHLHPAALIEVLDKITPHVKNGQVWITTHSINILAHFDPSNIWYIDNGEISYAGNIPQLVLEGLLGKEEEIERLAHFLSLPTQIASTKFAFECLFRPQVVLTDFNDPQVAQIHQIIKERTTNRDKLKVLDFGIGKGRLLSTISENERAKGQNVGDWLDFYGYDKYDADKEICIGVFDSIYGNQHNRYFNTQNDILARLDEKSLDVIIMCNVFHEIDPAEWLSLFTSSTSIFNLLKDDGHLVIVEDQQLAIGEKAHSKGFLVFDTLEFKKLFKMSASEIKTADYRADGRLKAHFIPKSCLGRIDIDSKKDALKALYESAKNQIKRLRIHETPASFKNGRLHAFWTQQLANASLALEEII